SLDLPADAEAVVATLMRVSTYSNAPDDLSADAAISQLQQSASYGVMYLDGGWKHLVDAVRATAVERGVEVRTESPCLAVRGDGDDHEIVLAADSLRARAVVVAVGGPETAERVLGLSATWRDRLGPPA